MLRKGREKMKKIIAIVSAVVLVGCLALVLTGCGAKDEEVLTTLTTTTTSPATTEIRNDGMVTDESIPGDNGVIGDIVTDISEGVSDMVTDVSQDMRNMRNAMR